MSFLSRYKTDTSLENDGVEVDFGDGVSVTVRRMNNKSAQELRRKLEKPYARMRETPDSVSENILNRVLAEAVVVGWKGVTDENGNELPFSPANAMKIFENPELRDFKEDIAMASMQRETFKAQADEEAEGN
jgi:hypothetical protein